MSTVIRFDTQRRVTHRARPGNPPPQAGILSATPHLNAASETFLQKVEYLASVRRETVWKLEELVDHLLFSHGGAQ